MRELISIAIVRVLVSVPVHLTLAPPGPTGKLTIRLNEAFIGTIKGVPREAVPGALLSGQGDMVRLRGVWSDRDQQMIEAGACVRVSLSLARALCLAHTRTRTRARTHAAASTCWRLSLSLSRAHSLIHARARTHTHTQR